MRTFLFLLTIGMTPLLAKAELAADALSYLGNIPDISFSYSINDNSPRRDIQFIKSGQRFSFKWLNEMQGHMEMYTYDGTRYYDLSSQQLAISRASFLSPSTGWFLDNPLYNAFRFFGGYEGAGFSPEMLMSPKVIGDVAELLARAKKGQTPNEKILKFECSYTEGYPLPSKLLCEGAGGHITKWEIASFAKVAGKHGVFLLPEKIVYEVRDELGRIVEGSSGSIEVDPGSIKVLDKPANINQFRVPISAVEHAFDCDTGVVLKGPDLVRAKPPAGD